MIRTAVLAMVVACSSGDTTSPQKPAPPVARVVTPRAKLPDVVRPLVPQHGIYAAGGGLTSAPWRVVVDVDAMTIYAGKGSQLNAPSYTALPKEGTKPLTVPNRDHLMKLANDTWTEPPPKTPPDVTADYDELIVVADGDETFYFDAGGPITNRPIAQKLVEDLRAAGGL